jgi:APA family basic amino acid/polyamine antiporter
MRAAMGARGAQIIAAGIAISALGFLSQSILTAPRVYFSMAADGVFFQTVARVNAHNVPGVAIALQSLSALVIALTGRYEQILNYAISMDFLFFGLTATTLFVFRRREMRAAQTPLTLAEQRTLGKRGAPGTGFRVPGHPVTTVVFIVASWLVFANSIYRYPKNTLIGIGILLLGIPVGMVWRRIGRENPNRTSGMQSTSAAQHDF